MNEQSDLRAGTASTDITPENGRKFQGYVRPDIRARGVAQRLRAHVLVLEKNETRVALISTDLLCGFDKDELLRHLRPLGFARRNVLYAGTHTHAATFEGSWTIAQIADAVEEADRNKVPARAGWAHARVDNVNQNRSLEAHLANHGLDFSPGEASPALDPEGSDHPRDTTLRLLRVEDDSGNPVGALCNFAVHPTTFTPHNTLYSSDLFGAARRHFQEVFSTETDPTVLFLNGTEGDLITTYDDYNQFALANTLGRRLCRGMQQAWNDAGTNLNHSIPLQASSTFAQYEGQEVEPGKTVGRRALFGLPFLGGAKNGPSFFYSLGLEGRKLPRKWSGEVHGRKIIMSAAPWTTTVEIQNLRIGSRRLLTVPGEPSVQMGRRVVEDVLEVSEPDLEDAMIVGLANGYHGYFTTPEEYDRQHYEGGHTVFGKHTEALIRVAQKKLTQETVESGSSIEDSSTDRSQDEPSRTRAPVGRIHSGRIVKTPSRTVERFDVVEVYWQGEGAGRDRPVGDPFIILERRTDSGWKPTCTDDDLGMIWFVEEDVYRAQYDVPGDITTGTYRFRINGTGYKLTSDPFRVEPSSNLRIRGAKSTSGSSGLLFHVQNPAPNPDRNLRPRVQIPQEGELSFLYKNENGSATWSEDHKAYRASVHGSNGDRVVVPRKGFTDSNGNYNGHRAEIVIGEVDELEWPENMATGGGSPPGPFGCGIPTVP